MDTPQYRKEWLESAVIIGKEWSFVRASAFALGVDDHAIGDVRKKTPVAGVSIESDSKKRPETR